MPKITTKPKTRLGKNLAAAGASTSKRRQPHWKGPAVDGITQSLLARYTVCPERFRVKTIEGLAPPEAWQRRIGYGNMWHICEEALAGDTNGTAWRQALLDHTKQMLAKYREQQVEIDKWYNVCLRQFPVYLKYWSEHPDVINRKPLLSEEVMSIPYRLPSGRWVRLRAKMDSLDLVGKAKKGSLYIQENKTPGEIDEMGYRRQMKFDLQTMVYPVMVEQLKAIIEDPDAACAGWDSAAFDIQPDGSVVQNVADTIMDNPLTGVIYNVVRRPLSGSKGTIKPHQPTQKNPAGESMTEFYDRLVRDYFDVMPETYFLRLKVDFHKGDIQKFKDEYLHPVLENLCDDYEWWSYCIQNGESPFNYMERQVKFKHYPRSYRTPYGIYNVIAEGGQGDVDEYLLTGSEVGLVRGQSLFPELENDR